MIYFIFLESIKQTSTILKVERERLRVDDRPKVGDDTDSGLYQGTNDTQTLRRGDELRVG